MKDLTSMTVKNSFKERIRSFLPRNLKYVGSKARIINNADLYSESLIGRWLRAVKFIADELRGGDVIFKSPDGLSYVTMPNNYSSFVTCVSGARDPEIWRFIKKTLKPGSVFVDAGANIGTYSLPVSKLVGARGKVFSFEAHPVTFSYLKRNLANNQISNTFAHNLALGDERGSIDMAFDSNNPGETHVAGGENGAIQVDLTTIDDALEHLNAGMIDYLKIDVEGYELAVLRGARGVLLRSQEAIVQTELNQKHASRYGHSISDVCDFLKALGFNPYRPDKNGDIHRLDLDISGDVIWKRS